MILVIKLVLWGNLKMLFKISSSFWAIIFVIGTIFLWVRKVDGSGAVNTSGNRLVSLIIWVLVFIVILAMHWFWYRRRKN